MILPRHVRPGQVGDVGANRADLVRNGSACQMPADSVEVDELDARQASHGGVDVGWHAEVENEEGPVADVRPSCPHLRSAA